MERRLGGTLELQEAIAKELTSEYFSLNHTLLANLPVKESVTTNYDVLFENASNVPYFGQKLSVLPYDRRESHEKWLLKMHGCVNHPSDIVLTRSDYIRYSEKRAALAGIVQVYFIFLKI